MGQRPANPEHRVAAIAGATGLVGSELLQRALADRRYVRVAALVRRPVEATHPKLVTVPADFERLGEVLADATADADSIDVYCCLGTTIAAAGSEREFARVDHDLVVALGRWAKRVDARRMVVVSALGADAASRVFYNRVKGETERDLRALGLRSLTIVRPSLLVGARTEFRLGEKLALLFTAPLLPLIPARIRPIDAADVAQAMLDAAHADQAPALVESAAMQGAARRSAASAAAARAR
jgi:uncharacterized protein YbjT (DUF2867 family)